MNARVRKGLGSLAVVAFLIVYTAAAVTVAGHLPNNRALHLVYFVIAGIAWIFPLFPVLSWMENGWAPKRR